MLMTQDRPVVTASAGYAARLMLNVPRASISMTDLKPLDVNSSAVARKLPAGPQVYWHMRWGSPMTMKWQLILLMQLATGNATLPQWLSQCQGSACVS